ncbi:hypothetical protein SBOR_6715 [Sclerotinia borealis F-4128]|uniref:Ubiquitin-like protease family profile domain-containing protein n=1 Tax=Sclerotinia borealis (strain F-4128) TaxID=1432307 RepID=W9CAN2_SCLBF|nr:hypothetical protein SBOR_6715 [Sclerotinia borealis F-4128]
MAAPRKTNTIMPTTLIPPNPPIPDPFGTKKRTRTTRVTTSNASTYHSNLSHLLKKQKIILHDPSTYPVTKSPPRPPIPRPDPKLLDSAVRLEMERRQFQPLSKEWFLRVLEEMYKVDEKRWSKWAVDMERMKVLKTDFRYLIKATEVGDIVLANGEVLGESLAHVPLTILDLYIFLACEYRNRAIARTLKGGDLAGDKPTTQKLSCISIDTQRIYWHPEKGKVNYEVGPGSTKKKQWIPQDFALAWGLTREALAQYDDDTFMNLDYVLIPFEYKSYHTIVIGIAPKQRFCFHIDNSGITDPRPQKKGMDESHLQQFHHNIFSMNILEAIVYEKFKKRILDTDGLPLYGQWHYRTDHAITASRTTDNSPNAPRQHDGFNCSMMALTSATSLIFGYDMMCWSNRDMNNAPPRVGKRTRVAAELLNGGFSKPFDYPLFKIPRKLQEIIMDESYKQNLRPPPPPKEEPEEISSEEEMSDEDEKEEETSPRQRGKGKPGPGKPGLGKPGLGKPDLGKRNLRKPSIKAALRKPGASKTSKTSQAGARTKVKKVEKGKGKGKKVVWAGQPASDPDPTKPEPPPDPNSDPTPSGTGSASNEEPVRTLWPVQMDPTRTGKCGMIYRIKKPMFTDPRFDDREECIRKAMMYRMVGWELWEHMPLHLFKAWMENVMAGRADEELIPWIDALELDHVPEPPELAPRSNRTSS